jgi:hypothetical protein
VIGHFQAQLDKTKDKIRHDSFWKFAPGVHINYAETVLPMRDGLPKLKDFPAEFGGSGEAIAE